MAKRTVFLHIGLPGVGDVVDTAVQRHRGRLAELGVLVPTKAREESFRAAIDVRRLHHAWGFKRKEVEGAWAQVARRCLKGRSTVLLSQGALAGATPEQIHLLVSQLPGLKVHVVLTVSAPDSWSEPGDPESDLAGVLERWSTAVRDPERLHVIVAPRGGDVRSTVWRALGEVVGFGTRSLPVEGLAPPPRRTPQRPLDAAAGARLRQRAAHWRSVLVEGGYDVRGDLADLEPAPYPASEVAATTDELVDRLVLTTRELVEAQHQIDRLAVRNETLEARLDVLDHKPRRLRGLGAA